MHWLCISGYPNNNTDVRIGHEGDEYPMIMNVRSWHTPEVEAKFLSVRFVPISYRCLARLSVFPCATKADIVTITTDG